ncbi:MAG: type II toxin-antitoxin system Phd/YefM family antitoxin [Thermoleophilia bacterium]|nr:type II toxin-antitoxin system Phd/YefM family antitoxin [Thermoleophilia bacterium]
MREVSATEASRTFSKLLDDIVHGHDSYLIVRHGRAIARLEPAGGAGGRALRELLRTRPRDPSWSRELADLRKDLTIEDRAWPD